MDMISSFGRAEEEAGRVGGGRRRGADGEIPTQTVEVWCSVDAQCQSNQHCMKSPGASSGYCMDNRAHRGSASLSGPGEVGGAVVGTAAGLIFVALAGVAAVGGIVGAGVAAAVAKPGQKPAYAKGAVIGAASLFGVGILSNLVK